MTRQTFKTTDVLKLEVEQTPTGLVNQIRNPPDPDYFWTFPATGIVAGSGFGWTTDVGVVNGIDVGTPAGRTDQWLRWAMTNGVPNAFYSENWAHSAGEYAAARIQAAVFNGVTAWYRLAIEWINSAGAVFSTSATSTVTQGTRVDTTGGVTVSLGAQLAPAGTVRARLRVDLFATAGGGNTAGGTIYWKDATAAKASTSAALSGLPVISPVPTWVNVIGPTHTISVNRSALNLGILTAEILDASIDPSQSTLVRPGKRCRLMALNNATGLWSPLFRGKISRGETSYDPTRTDAKRARVTLTAVDAAAELSQINRTLGVTDPKWLWKPLEGSGVPSRISTVSYPYTAYTTPSRSLLDQIAMIRDSTLGYAWVDRKGVLNVWRKVDMPSTPLTTLSESKYSALSVDYDTDRCINVVNVKLRRTNAANGTEVEVPYGPYVDQASIDQWGAHSADFTVVGITDSDAAAAAYAAPILTANATPAVRINAVEIPIRDTTDVTTLKAFLDVMDLVTVANTNAGISQAMVITALEHKINDGKWQLNLSFTVNNSVAAPQAVSTSGVISSAQGDANWTALPFAAGWADYGGGFQPCQYMKRNGFLYIRGLVKRTGANVAALTPICTLPAGFRPQASLAYAVSASPTGVGEAGHAVFVDSAGNVSISTATMNTNGYAYMGLPPIALD